MHMCVSCMNTLYVASCSTHATHRLVPSLKIRRNRILKSKIDIRTFEGLCVCFCRLMQFDSWMLLGDYFFNLFSDTSDFHFGGKFPSIYFLAVIINVRTGTDN